MASETLWVSRDSYDGGDVCLWGVEPPELDTDGEWVAGSRCRHLGILELNWFPHLKPGECRRVTLTLAPEEASDGR